MNANINIAAIDEARTKQEARDTVHNLLSQFADEHIATAEAVAFHETPKNKVSLPNGMTVSKGARVLTEAAAAELERTETTRTFRYRPWDGAAGVSRVMQKFFGTSGRGKPIQTMFGSIPPQQIEIEIAYNERISVPWGHIEFEHLEGTIQLGSTQDEEYGLLFSVTIEAPKKYSPQISGFFNLLEMELKERSIYKGKAIRGTDNPTFLPPGIDESIVYNDDVYESLEQAVWGVIKHTDLARANKTKIDPKVLLHGPYGTGKSETGRLTAKIAVDNGWTFVSYNSGGKGGLDALQSTLQTARLLAPAVVFVEDVDIFAKDTGDDRKQSQVLEMFDGISSKGREVMVLMTSNHPSKFDAGMLRAGRINKMIEIGALNKDATERLIRTLNKGRIAEDVDFEQVWEAMEGYEPSFVRQTFDDARQSAAFRNANRLVREKGSYTMEEAMDYMLQTEDFVTAANIMRPQHTRHYEAANRTQGATTIDDLVAASVERIVTEVTNKSYLDARGGERIKVSEDA